LLVFGPAPAPPTNPTFFLKRYHWYYEYII
jgi:hypothetical protein